MFCSLAGLSPCDIILQDIDSRVVKNLLQALNNRFDKETLLLVKAEFTYVLGILDSLIFDYKNKEDRVLSKKFKAAPMTAFDDDERGKVSWHLSTAEKSFTGNVRTGGGIFAVSSEEAKAILGKLYAGKTRLSLICESITCGDFTDEVFFGKPLIRWANSRNHSWLSGYVFERIEMKDGVDRLRRDAENLLSYVSGEEESDVIEAIIPTFDDVKNRYAQLTGAVMLKSEKEIAMEFIGQLHLMELKNLGPAVVTSLLSAFVHCLSASKQYDEHLTEQLESAGLYFLNPVRGQYFLSQLSNLTLIPDRRISLKNLKTGDTYETILKAIMAACDNDQIPIGSRL